MKRLHITVNVLKSLMLAGLLTACHNDQMISPSESTEAIESDRNARGVDIKLVKFGDAKIQYIKNGRFAGKVSKVTDDDADGYRTEYSYSAYNGTGDFWITSTRHRKIDNELIEKIKYHISNGYCIESENAKIDESSAYEYNAGLLQKVTVTNPAKTIIWDLSYYFNPSTKTHRLSKYSYYTSGGISGEYILNYTSLPDKYFLNPGYLPLSKHLPYFGQFSDVLVQDIKPTSYNTPNNAVPIECFGYITDGNGYVTTKTRTYYPLGKGNNLAVEVNSIDLKYSAYWQGLP